MKGADAKALLGGWTNFALDGKSREVRGPTWGYALAYMSQTVPDKKFPLRMSGLVIAVPGAGGAWSVVGVHFTGAN